MIFSKEISADISKIGVDSSIRFHEGDVNGSELKITLYKDKVPFNLSTFTIKYDATIDEFLAEEDATASATNNVITIPITENMTARSGVLRIDVKLIKENDVAFIQTVEAFVQRSVINTDTIVDISGTTIKGKFDDIENDIQGLNRRIDELDPDTPAGGYVPESRTVADIALSANIPATTLGRALPCSYVYVGARTLPPTNARVGDIWIKTDTNSVSIYNGISWVEIDSSSASSKMDLIPTITSDNTSKISLGQIFEYNNIYYIKSSLATPVSSQMRIVKPDDLPTKTSDLTNDSGFLTEQTTIPEVPVVQYHGEKIPDVSSAAFAAIKVDQLFISETETEVPKAFRKMTGNDYIQVSGLAHLSDIPSIPSNISAFNNDAGYLTSHQDISGKMNLAVTVTVSVDAEHDSTENVPMGQVFKYNGDYYIKQSAAAPVSAQYHITDFNDLPSTISELDNDVNSAGEGHTRIYLANFNATPANVTGSAYDPGFRYGDVVFYPKIGCFYQCTYFSKYNLNSGGSRYSYQLSKINLKTSQFTNDAGFLTAHQDISGKEDVSNKSTSLSASSTDNEYPSAKCVYDLIGDIESVLAALL